VQLTLFLSGLERAGAAELCPVHIKFVYSARVERVGRPKTYSPA